MKSISIATVLSVSCMAFGAFADGSEGLSQRRGPWSISIGPSWRSRVKLETHGTVAAPAVTPRSTILGVDTQDPANWKSTATAKKNPNWPDYDVQNKFLWGVSSERQEIFGVAGRDYVVSDSDTDAPLGLNLQACYDFLRWDTLSIGLNLRFAAYWNMRSSTSGLFYAGGTRTQTYTDWYLFSGNGYSGVFDSDVDREYDRPDQNISCSDMTDSYVDKGSHIVNTRIRSDLYQIALGPKVTWSPFEGWCRPLSWIDVYGGVEVLCNIAYSKLDADGASGSSTDCLIGFGGNLGLVGNITDWLGVYGQVGYEWVDKTDVSAGSFKADVDYSSLVVSAGLQFSF